MTRVWTCGLLTSLPYSGTFKLSGSRFGLIEVLNVKSCKC